MAVFTPVNRPELAQWLAGFDLGDAAARPLVLAGPGAHRLQLLDPGGKVVDSLMFTVR